MDTRLTDDNNQDVERGGIEKNAKKGKSRAVSVDVVVESKRMSRNSVLRSLCQGRKEHVP